MAARLRAALPPFSCAAAAWIRRAGPFARLGVAEAQRGAGQVGDLFAAMAAFLEGGDLSREEAASLEGKLVGLPLVVEAGGLTAL